MSSPGETSAQRRARLTAEIARQRGAFTQAYLNLQKPIEMGESGLRVFGFIRQNSWVFVAVPAALRVITFFVGLRGATKAEKPAPRPRFEKERPRNFAFASHAVKWGGRGVKLFKIYRRVRSFFP